MTIILGVGSAELLQTIQHNKNEPYLANMFGKSQNRKKQKRQKSKRAEQALRSVLSDLENLEYEINIFQIS